MDKWVPTMIVFFAFCASLAVYTVLELNGSDTSAVTELFPYLGGAVAGIAAPTVVSGAMAGKKE